MFTLLLGLLVQVVILLIIAAVIYIVFKKPFDLPFLSSDKLPALEKAARSLNRGDSPAHTVRQMRSSTHSLALGAVETARAQGWLTDGTLEGATLRLGNLRAADLRGAKLAGANLSYANLTTAQLADAHLVNTDLSQANLQQANLDRADLRGAQMESANLEGVSLVGALYNSRTRWPSGFDVTETEAIDVEQLVKETQARLQV